VICATKSSAVCTRLKPLKRGANDKYRMSSSRLAGHSLRASDLVDAYREREQSKTIGARDIYGAEISPRCGV
jgi:hypothetical protein